MKNLLTLGGLLALVSTLLWAAPAHAAFHWQIVQVYSNADGTVQFIELEDKTDGENDVSGQTITTQSGHSFTFPGNLGSGTTKNAHMLLGTPGYVARAGVPPADFNLGANTFFSITGGDTITYASGGTTLNSLAYTTGQLPLDNLRSLNRAYNSHKPTAFTFKSNAPTNFLGETGIALEPGKFVEMPLAKIQFRNGVEDQANSTPQTIGSAYHYNFDISGHVQGSGRFGSRIVPHGTPIGQFFNAVEPGAGDAFHGRIFINQFIDTYPLVNESFNGSLPVTVLGHNTGVSVAIGGQLSSGVDDGLATFQCANVSIQVNNNADSADFITFGPDCRLLGYNADIIKSDFNVDGQSDLVLFKPATGQVEITELKNDKFLHGTQGGSTFYALSKAAVPAGFVPVDIGEFGPLAPGNTIGDGYPDLLLFNSSTTPPTASVLYMKNLAATTTPATVAALPSDAIPTGFLVGGIGDFDIDQFMDLLIYNPTTLATQIVYLKGVAYRGGSRSNSFASGPTLPAGYIVQGVSDFNDDGSPDLLLYNPTDNTTKCMFMNNATQLGTTVDGPTVPEGYVLVGSGGFEPNRHVDLIIFNPTKRIVEFILLDGKTFTQTSIEKLGVFPKGVEIVGPR